MNIATDILFAILGAAAGYLIGSRTGRALETKRRNAKIGTCVGVLAVVGLCLVLACFHKTLE
jgi:uncharacterized membrane protein YfcA